MRGRKPITRAMISRDWNWSRHNRHRLSHFFDDICCEYLDGAKKTISADTILAGASEFEAVDPSVFNVAINAAATDIGKFRRVVNTHEARVVITARAPNPFVEKRCRGGHGREPHRAGLNRRQATYPIIPECGGGKPLMGASIYRAAPKSNLFWTPIPFG